MNASHRSTAASTLLEGFPTTESVSRLRTEAVPGASSGRPPLAGATSGGPRPGLLGRRDESRALQQLLVGVREGCGQVLVIRGEAGVGKTALLDELAGRVADCRVVRVVGIESEMELAFAALHQLCAPVLDLLGRLPQPQRDALVTAFGFSAGAPPDPFLVGLAVLSLLAEAAEEEPVLLLVDDAQWLDEVSGRTLSFVARRLCAERIAIVFAVRDSYDEVLADLPELAVAALSDEDSHHLLESVIAGPIDERVGNRIVAESRGNPLAIRQLAGGLTPAMHAGGYGLPEWVPMSHRIEQGFAEQLESLPDETRILLLTAAVDSTGDVPLLWRALERLHVRGDAAAPAEAAGLIEIGVEVRFPHPLVRSAVCRAAEPADLRAVHRALAEVTDRGFDPDRLAWHRAHATIGPDEDVAAELERCADRARNRGGEAAAAAFLERATELTPQWERRGARALAAAQAKFRSAAYDDARALLGVAFSCPLDARSRAWGDRLRGLLALTSGMPGDISSVLIDAATTLAPLDGARARAACFEAFSAVFFGDQEGDDCLHRVARAVRAIPRPDPAQPLDLLLDGLAQRFADQREADASVLSTAVAACAAEAESASQEDLPGMVLASTISPDLWDDEAWEQLTRRVVRAARATGALSALPLALNYRASAHVNAGRFHAASALLDEADAISEATGQPSVVFTRLELAAWQGRAETTLLVDAVVDRRAAHHSRRPEMLAHHARAVLCNGVGRYSEALHSAELSCRHEDPYLLGRSLAELVEAAVRSGDHEGAAAALCRLRRRTAAAGTDWAAGIEARSTALLSDGEEAGALYREAVERLGRTRLPAQLARAHLLYGEWLRRGGRRVDSRDQLRIAHEMFTTMGADGFAERARRELMATGETVRKRSFDTRVELTAQEAQIARLAADGHTNPEIGSLLFLSPRTVEWHLRKVYTKLGIASRRELRHSLGDTPSARLRSGAVNAISGQPLP